MRLNWVLLPREPGSASFYERFRSRRRLFAPSKTRDDACYFLAGFAGVEAAA